MLFRQLLARRWAQMFRSRVTSRARSRRGRTRPRLTELEPRIALAGQVFVLGLDNQVYTQNAAASNGPVAYSLAAHGLVKALSVSQDAAGNPELFVLGLDSQVWDLRFDAAGHPLGSFSLAAHGQVKSIAPGHDAAGNPDLFAIGLDSQVWELKFDPSGSPAAAYSLAAHGQVKDLALGKAPQGQPLLFALGLDSQVYSLEFDPAGNPAGNYALTAQGRVLSFAPTNDAAGDPELLALGLDSQVWDLHFDAAATPAGGYSLAAHGAVKGLAVSRLPGGAPEAFVLGLDSQLYALKFDTSANPAGPYFLTTHGLVKDFAPGQDAAGNPHALVRGLDDQVYALGFDAAGNPTGGYALAAPGLVRALATDRTPATARTTPAAPGGGIIGAPGGAPGGTPGGNPTTPPPDYTGVATLQLFAPAVSLVATPSVNVVVNPATSLPPGATLNLDVDINSDMQFSGAGETGAFRNVPFTPGQAVSLTLPALPSGYHTVRARLSDASGFTIAQAVNAVAVNPDANSQQLLFEPNVGQTSFSNAQFLTRGHDYLAYLTGAGPVLEVPPAAQANPSTNATPLELPIYLLGANLGSPQAQDPQVTRSNYFYGNDPARWHTDVPNYTGVVYHNALPGIDASFSGVAGQLNMDFVVQPGADPSAIHLDFSRWGSLAIDKAGELVITMADGSVLTQSPPVLTQQVGTAQQSVAGQYTLLGNGQVGFQVTGAYDHTRPLNIDPTLAFLTFLGGSKNESGGTSIAVDPTGAVYVVGQTQSTDFPLLNSLQNSYPKGANHVITVTRYDPIGLKPTYSSYIGGSSDNYGNNIAVDGSGNAYVAGSSNDSSGFPTTAGAYLSAPPASIGSNAVAFKLSPAGNALVYSTFITGSVFFGSSNGIAVDGAGDAYLTGTTGGNNLKTTPGAYQPSTDPKVNNSQNNVGWVAELNPAGSQLVFATNLTGTSSSFVFNNGTVPRDIAIDTAGNVHVTGYTDATDFPTVNAAQGALLGNSNAFVTTLNPTGTALLYSTYLGGKGGGKTIDSHGRSIAVDGKTGAAYVIGTTNATDFPVTAGAYQFNNQGGADIFVSKLSPTGALAASTYIGTTGVDEGTSIALDGSDNVYVGGLTNSPTYPQVNNPLTPLTALNSVDGVVSVLDPTLKTLLFSTNIGGLGDDSVGAPFTAGSFGLFSFLSSHANGNVLALDPAGNIWVTGQTTSISGPDPTKGFFPVTNASQANNAGGIDDFVAKITPVTASPPPGGPGGPGGPGTPGGPPAPISLPGDRYEPNQTSDAATNFGALTVKTTLTGLTINLPNGLPDYDWYRWTMPTAGTLSILSNVSQGDVEIHVFTVSGPTNTLVELASSTAPGLTPRAFSLAVSAGMPILIEAKGIQSVQGGALVTSQGVYDLTLNLA